MLSLRFQPFIFLRAHLEPIGEARRIEFPSADLSPAQQLQFLEDDFRIVKNLRELPKPILDVLTEESGRLTMVNPGRQFEATDNINDPSLPNGRLIFAGVTSKKVFLHYEQGGMGHMFILAFFAINKQGKIEPVWRGYCGPAADLNDLVTQIGNGRCSDAVPREIR